MRAAPPDRPSGGLRAPLMRALVRLGAPRLMRSQHRRALLVLCYHGLRRDDDRARHWLLMPEADFGRQMEYVARHYDCVPLDEAVAALQAGTLTRPTAAVTFDDGYRSNREIALPILRRLGIPATVFLPTGLIDRGALIWPMWLELAIAASPGIVLDLREAGGSCHTLAPAPAANTATARRLIDALKRVADHERRATLALAAGQLNPPRDTTAFALLDWSEIREAEREGILSFGAHTRTHPIVSRLGDAALREEIAGSIEDLEREVRRPSRVFAFPNGRREDFDARALAEVRRAGGIAALSTIDDLNTSADPDRAVARITLGADDSFDSFCLRTSGMAALLRGHPGRFTRSE